MAASVTVERSVIGALLTALVTVALMWATKGDDRDSWATEKGEVIAAQAAVLEANTRQDTAIVTLSDKVTGLDQSVRAELQSLVKQISDLRVDLARTDGLRESMVQQLTVTRDALAELTRQLQASHVPAGR